MNALDTAKSRWGWAEVVDASTPAAWATAPACPECGSRRVYLYDPEAQRRPMCGDCGAPVPMEGAGQ